MTISQCTTYDGTLNTNQNVLKITFSEATSTAPILTAWDDSNLNSVTNEILAGTSGTSNTSWLKAVETTSGAPGSSWTSSTVSLDDNSNPAGGPNALKGNDRFVPCASTASAGSSKLFNIVCYVPSDANSGTSGHTFVLSIRYSYTGTEPTITFYANTGSEASPTWTEISSGDTIYFAGPDTTSTSVDPVTAPSSGSKIVEEMWVGTV